MSEDDARAWVAERFGSAAVGRLANFARLLTEENGRQNLVAPSTIPMIWTRHLVDSAQLAAWGGPEGLWVDIGTGGGLPGLVLALLLDRPFLLVEPRRLRAAFLERCVEYFDLRARVAVATRKVEAVTAHASTISARAVTGLDLLVASSRHLADAGTIWILPRGQSGAAELQSSRLRRQGTFHVELSLTDPAATIIVATGLGGS